MKCRSLFIIIIFWFLSLSSLDGGNVPSAKNGILDLRDYNFNSGSIALQGEWKFYWKKFIAPELFKDDYASLKGKDVEVHNVWNSYIINGKDLSGIGFATYHLKILLDHSQENLTLEIVDVGTAYKVFIDGKLSASSGTISQNEKDSIAKLQPLRVDLPKTRGSIDIVFHISNFHYSKGGIWHPITLGRKSVIHKNNIYEMILSFFLAGCLLIIGIYHIIVFLFRKKERQFLYFGILCIVIIFRILTTTYRNILVIFPDLTHELIIKTEYLTFYMGMAITALVFYSLFKDEFKYIVLKIIFIIAGLFSMVVLFTPAKIYTHTVTVYQIITLLIILYLIYVMILSVKRKKEGALIILLGSTFGFLTVVNDILFAQKIITTFNMAPVGLIVLILSQAAVISKRFANSFTRVEYLSLELEHINENLEKMVEDKTKKLTDSEYKYRNLIENASDIIHTSDTIGNVKYISPSGLKILGYSEDEVVHKNVIDFIVPEHHEGLFKFYQNQYHKKIDETYYEYRIKDKQGNERWVGQKTNLIYDNGKIKGFYNIARDITDRRNISEALKNSELRYRSIIENMLEGYYEVDLKGYINYCNDSFLKITGYERGDLVGRSYSDIMHKEEAKRTFDVFHKIFLAKESSDIFDWKFVAKDGTDRISEGTASLMMESDNKVIGFRGVIRDITEKMRVVEDLRRSEERYRDLAESLPEIVFEMDVTGKITFVNKIATKLLGFTYEEMLSGNPLDFVQKGKRKEAAKGILDSTLGNRLFSGSESNFLKKDGTLLPVHIHTSQIMKDGELIGIRGIGVDISSIKESQRIIEERNIEIENELEIARKLQQNLLPSSKPQIQGINYSSLYIPMEKVGGDFYNWRLRDNKLELLIADVSGHGLASAFLASISKTAFDSLPPGLGTAETMQQLNHFVSRYSVEGNFITAFLCQIDVENKKMEFSNAGHFPPYLYRNKTKEIIELHTSGRILGWMDSVEYQSKSIDLEKGDRIVLYTDGILETTNAQRELFGDDRLKDYISLNNNKEPDDFSIGLVDEITGFSEEESFEDDITLVLVDIL